MNEYSGLPHNHDCERTVLGAMLDHVTGMRQALRLGVRAEDFTLESHRRILRAMLALPADGVDLVTICDELGRRGELDMVGGDAYVCSLTDGVGLRSDISNHIRILKQKALWRAFIRETEAAAALAYEEADSPEAAIQNLRAQLDKLSCSGPATAENVLVNGQQFICRSALSVDWLVEGVIQRDANGVICAEPKAGKSWAAADLAISLALGCSWLGRRVPRPVKTALISREDGPPLTSWRLRHLALGREARGISIDSLESNLWVNSRAQTAAFSLDNPEQLADMVRALRSREIEFAIFDVLNVLHGADENDAQQMRAVMQKLSLIQTEAGCSVAVVHHLNKGESGSLMRRLRGSSAIAGWVEWLIGITVVDDDTKLRRMDFIGKASASIDPIHYFIVDNDAAGTCALELADASCVPQKHEPSARVRPI
jgi:hypothetical protein